MLGFEVFSINTDKIQTLLEEFEQFCLGKKHLSPQRFTDLNEELSVGAVMKIGRNRMERQPDGNHLIWVAPDQSEHDLGPIEKLNVRDYPGFHRTRSLSLGQNEVDNNEIVHIPATDQNISKVKLKDGSVGYGPNYKLALRNAALKMHLKKDFEKANPQGLWKMFYANA